MTGTITDLTNQAITPIVTTLYTDKTTIKTNELDNYLSILQSKDLFNKPKILSVIKEIQIVCDDLCQISNKQWTQIIEDNYANIIFYSFVINSSDGNIIINIDVVKAYAQIPKIYTSIQVCSRSGNRKFHVAGPRKNQCTTHHIERGINENEIKYVTKLLDNCLRNSITL